MTDIEYEQLRNDCIKAYRKVFKDSLAFDICKVDKPTRVRLQEDDVYKRETASIKANLFCDLINKLDSVIAGVYAEDGKEKTANILSALDKKQKILLEDININADESNALNVVYIAMDKDDYEKDDRVDVFEGSNANKDATNLGADFGMNDEELGAEGRAKKDVQDRLRAEKEKNKEEQNVLTEEQKLEIENENLKRLIENSKEKMKRKEKKKENRKEIKRKKEENGS